MQVALDILISNDVIKMSEAMSAKRTKGQKRTKIQKRHDNARDVLKAKQAAFDARKSVEILPKSEPIEIQICPVYVATSIDSLFEQPEYTGGFAHLGNSRSGSGNNGNNWKK